MTDAERESMDRIRGRVHELETVIQMVQGTLAEYVREQEPTEAESS